MKKRDKLPSETLATLAIALPGAMGLSVVVRALFVYLGHDPLASLIVVAMGVGLSVGLVELFMRKRRALALQREVSTLPRPATEAAIDAASPQLAAFLRARIEHAPFAAMTESLTPYLVGLMVMLGLLGTLLGLFETLQGAGHVLTSSGNVDALRSGLTGPMRGLTRSFGCSAAGVSASAMLGLAAALVRRMESRAVAAMHAYATGPLRELSPVRRQLSALERLASQGDSLPRAADALALAADRVGTLADRWDEAHRKAAEAQHRSLTAAFESLRQELARGAAEAGRTLTETVTPLVKHMVTQTGEAAAKHMSATLAALEQDLSARREADAAMRTAMRDELGAMRAWASEDARAKSDDIQQRLGLIEKAMKGHASEQAALLALQREQTGAHLEALESAVNGKLEEQTAALALQREQAAQHVASVAEVARTLASSLTEGRAEERARIAELRAELERQNTALSERWAELAREVSQSAQAARGELEQQNAVLSERWAELAREVSQSAQATHGELEQQNAVLSERWAELAREVSRTADATRVEEEARLLRLDSLTQRFGADLGQLAGAMAEQLNARLERERAQAERAEQAMEALATSGRTLEDALARQELAVQVLLEGGAEQFSKIGALSQEGAREAVAKLMTVTEQQAARFAEFEAQLEGKQTAFTQQLTAELAAQAERLGKGLEGTTQLVQEAAAVLKASSVEMGTVAELFAKSTERQREAAQAWMESLGEVEGAVERAGRGAAADALGDQLASTQEVFARQLQFQRELFEQLRSFRASSTVAARGEQDASA